MSRANRFEYTDWKGFGNRVKQYREQIGLTKEKFSEMINRTENYISELEKGNNSCSVHTLYQISNALRVPSDKLLYGEKMSDKKENSNKEILYEIIDRCSDEEVKVIKEIIVATYPNLDQILKSRKNNNKQ